MSNIKRTIAVFVSALVVSSAAAAQDNAKNKNASVLDVIHAKTSAISQLRR